MGGKKVLLGGKTRWFIGLLCIIMGISASFINKPESPSTNATETHRQIALRNIGHELLKLAGNLHTPVPPVDVTTQGTYILSLPKEISILPDSLYTISQSVLSHYQIETPYQIQVIRCSDLAFVYGYEVSSQAPNEISCLDRPLETNCYNIQIRFLDTPSETASNPQPWIMGSTIIMLGIVGLVLFKPRNAHKNTQEDKSNQSNAIGDILFMMEKRKLTTPVGEEILSEKEVKVLRILSHTPNTLITRDQLLKEGWEDEGVYTSRSLDMFISKLRKKLSDSKLVTIETVRGQGYKLVVRET